MPIADADIWTSLLPAVTGPAGAVVLLCIFGYLLWRKNEKREDQIARLNEERIKGLVLDIQFRQDTIQQVLAAGAKTQSSLTQLISSVEVVSRGMEGIDNDLERVADVVQEIRETAHLAQTQLNLLVNFAGDGRAGDTRGSNPGPERRERKPRPPA